MYHGIGLCDTGNIEHMAVLGRKYLPSALPLLRTFDQEKVLTTPRSAAPASAIAAQVKARCQVIPNHVPEITWDDSCLAQKAP